MQKQTFFYRSKVKGDLVEEKMAKKNSYFIVAVSLYRCSPDQISPVGRLVKHFFFDGDFAVYLPHKKAQKDRSR